MRSALVTLLAAAAVAVAAVGCSSPVSPKDALRIETSISGTTIRPGEPVTVSVVVTNRGGRTQQIHAESGFCPAPFVVIPDDGREIRPSAICSLALHPPKELAPGESVTLTSRWSGDSQPGGLPHEPSTTLPAGAYRVRGSVVVLGYGLLEGPSVEVRIVR